MKKNPRILAGGMIAFVTLASTPLAVAQEKKVESLPVTAVSLFSSGVGYFEHNGVVSGNARVFLSFSVDAVNDVLKSLVIHDPGSSSPSVRYESSDSLLQSLRSLRIDLSNAPSVAEILGGMRGADITVRAPDAIEGRILGVETRMSEAGETDADTFLSLVTPTGIRVIRFSEISSFAFSDPAVEADLSKALDLILSSRGANTRAIAVSLPGKGERKVSLGYVVPAPVWKASYRLDLGASKPFFQGWAIVDNASDSDWDNVALSLVNGKPVSFVQELYPPLWFARPVVPLSIAGSATAATYDSGYDAFGSLAEESADEERAAPAAAPLMKSRAAQQSNPLYAGSSVGLGAQNAETARTSVAGELFVFTAQKPVSIARHSSAMIPLVETTLQAEKISVISGAKLIAGVMSHPMLCASLVNTSGMRLPAGPITVFDGGSYAGDALIEFFPEGDRRIIAFGEDLAVNVGVTATGSTAIDSVAVSNGVMTMSRKIAYAKKYSIRNLGSETKKIIVEHPIVPGSALAAPSKYEEKTDSAYRFAVSVAAKGEETLEVKEQVPVRDAIVLSDLTLDAFVRYSTSGDIPSKVRAALSKAVDHLRAISAAESRLADIESRRQEAVDYQDRIRQNLEAAGSDSAQGKEYLRKLAESDAEIDKYGADIELARKSVGDARALYENYIAGLSL